MIPAWSIHWITTIKDYFACTGDLGTVRDLLPGVRAVLDWFRRHADADGLPSKLPFWNVTDWCPWWPRGVVPGADTGVTVIFSAQFIQALDEAGWLYLLIAVTLVLFGSGTISLDKLFHLGESWGKPKKKKGW